MIKAMVIGNIGADAVVKNINGVDYTTFSVAHSVKKSTGEEKTTWVDCMMRGAGALNQYLVKGQMVFVLGDFDARLYDSLKYRCKMISYTMFVESLRLCGAKPEARTNDQVPSNVDPVTGEILVDDDTPFGEEPTAADPFNMMAQVQEPPKTRGRKKS